MAGSNDLQLQLRDGTNTYTFNYDGRLRIEQEYQYNENPEPPELRQIVESWHVDSARIVGATQADAWDNLQTFLGHVEDSATTPLTHARLVRSGNVERTLGDTVGEGFRLERLTLGEEPVPELETSEMRTVWPVSFVLSAVRIFSDGNGISAWEQKVRSTYDRAGLHTLEWETAISVAEGSATTALTHAETYAVIPIADYGNTYVWDTNGPSSTGGYDVEEDNPDTRDDPDKTATKLKIISRIKQKGITVGSPSAGDSVGNVELTTITETSANKTRLITEAMAEGPGALTWVQNQRPNGQITESIIRNDKASRVVFGRWVVEDNSENGNVSDRRELQVTVSGGGQSFDMVPVPAGFPPQYSPGVRLPWRADVVVRMETTGEFLTPDDMKFPPKLLDPWVFAPELSREDGWPRISKPGADQNAATWVREAHAVYMATDGVNQQDFAVLYDPLSPSVSSYLFDG